MVPWLIAPNAKPMLHHVLVVDPDSDSRGILAVYFEHHGYSVSQAGNRKRAVELAAARPPDLVIGDFLDLQDHRHLVRALRQEHGSAAAILCVTGWASRAAVAEAVELADAVLTKPVEPKVVLHEARRLLIRDSQPAAPVGSRGAGPGSG